MALLPIPLPNAGITAVEPGRAGVYSLSELSRQTQLVRAMASMWRTVDLSATAVSHTGDTSETTLATVEVPADVLGVDGMLRITSVWSFTNSANNKTLFLRFGGAAGTAYLNVVLTTQVSYRDQRQIANRGAVNSQIGGSYSTVGGWGSSANANVTSSIDTNDAQDLVFRCQLANAGETITLESYLVELLAPMP